MEQPKPPPPQAVGSRGLPGASGLPSSTLPGAMHAAEGRTPGTEAKGATGASVRSMADTGVASGASEAVVRGELVDKPGHGPTLIAVRRLRWGTAILSERPVLLVEADPGSYLKVGDADPRLAQLAEALGDPVRLAAYVAFKQLHERKQRELLSFWREGIEDADPVAKAIIEQNRRGVEAFKEDRPEFAKLVYWNHFILVASIFGRFGRENPDGSRAVYGYCSHVRHSCRPNAAWFTNRTGFPKGKKTLHAVAIEGIPRGEEITVTEYPESLLLLPRAERSLRMFRGTGLKCECKRCTDGDDEADRRIGELFARITALLNVKPPTDESTKEALQNIKALDKLLPFSMQMKAKVKVLLASSMGELSQRAAWQEESKSANIIQWTGLDAGLQEQRLKDTKKLYETAAKDFEYLLGQDALDILKRMEQGYGHVHDQHKMLAKYAKEREPQEAEREANAGPQHLQGQAQVPTNAGGEGMPPGWNELFKSAQR